jgi:hypothetical protein
MIKKLNTSPSFRDVKLLVYKEVWFYHVKRLKTELFSLLTWDDDKLGWLGKTYCEYYFQFRDLTNGDDGMFCYVSRIFTNIGKPVDHAIDSHDKVSPLPTCYYYTSNNNHRNR